MKTHPNEIWIFYDKDSASHKKTKALAYTISKHVHEFCYCDDKVNARMWADILDLLKMEPKEILDKSKPKYQKELARHDFSREDWLTILANNPELIKAPIAIHEKDAVLCLKPKDIYKIAPEKAETY